MNSIIVIYKCFRLDGELYLIVNGSTKMTLTALEMLFFPVLSGA